MPRKPLTVVVGIALLTGVVTLGILKFAGSAHAQTASRRYILTTFDVSAKSYSSDIENAFDAMLKKPDYARYELVTSSYVADKQQLVFVWRLR